MFVPFENIGAQSRIWIYQSDRELTRAEEEIVGKALRLFCDQWSAHGNPLQTSFRVDYRHFLILSVDEDFNGTSGCSIDGSVQLLKALQAQLNINFFDRSQVAFLIDGKVKLIPFKELKATFASGILSPSSLAFNTLAGTRREWEETGLKPAGNSWVAKYLPGPAMAQ